ncbi:MAG TPA: shikimate kinase AroK [Woeseiaceae bacterium]|nr:shikimate kinase AroK [Woeseiaceae bacterium]|tara:strand:- start:23968 stop:24480 length:513 start_codon:yes stop_codon:yes gene_type:complete
MNQSKNYFLVGPMGAGKTAVGRQLAILLNYEFIDSDEEIELRTGVDIPFIFEKEGESGFRKREKKVIDEMTERNNIVLATGGGAILSEHNRKHLISRGLVIYLFASIKKQVERTSRGKERPLINNQDSRKILHDLMKIREPLYRNIADFIIMTDGRKINSVAKEIFNEIT